MPILAAGSLHIFTVADPFAIGWGAGGVTEAHISVIRAAGSLQTSTVTAQGGIIGIGAGTGTGAGGAHIGQICISVTRA
jgi:hypothetical protein